MSQIHTKQTVQSNSWMNNYEPLFLMNPQTSWTNDSNESAQIYSATRVAPGPIPERIID